MANKTNVTINGRDYYKLKRKVGQKRNKAGAWVAEYKIFYGKNKQEAEKKYRAYMERGRVDTRCFGELVDLFIDSVLLPDPALKPTTKSRYVNAYRLVFGSSDILGKDIDEITGLDLQRVLSGSSYAASSVRAAYKLVKRFYTYAAAQRLADDITPGIVLPAVNSRRQDQRIDTFSAEELQRFRDGIPAGHRLRLLVILGIETGARVAELLALRYEDLAGGSMIINKSLAEIDPIKTPDGSREKTRAEILATKTLHSVRAVPLSEYAQKEIAAHKKWHTAEMRKNGYKTDFVFTTASGSLYYKSTVRTAFYRLCKRVGVEPRGFHTFRHTFGSRLAAAGVPIQTVSQLMGHSDISVTAAYYINVPEDQKRAAIELLAGIPGDPAQKKNRRSE